LDRSRFHVAYIFLLCLILYFLFLGARDFWEAENQYAEIVRVMLLDGDYALPKVNGTLWADNPPLYFWLALLFSWMAGQVNEWTVRLPSALSATALIVSFYLFSRKWFDARVALLSTLVLATSLLTIHVEHHIPVNMTFFLCVALSMFLLMEILVFDSVRPLHVYGAWFFIGLACLTKAPISVLFPAVVVLLYLSFSRRWAKVSVLRLISGGLLFLLITVPWFAFVIWRTSGVWADVFFAQHHIWRNSGHSQPFYYAAVFFLAGFIPWSFLFLPAILSLWTERSKIRDGALLFLFLWFLSTLLFAQLFDGHHNHYLFLAVLPAALALGLYLDRLTSSTLSDPVRLWTHGCVWAFSFFLGFIGIAAPVVAARDLPDLSGQIALFGFITVAAAVGIVYALRKRNYRAVVGGFAALLLVADLQIQALIFPSLNRLEIRPFAEQVGALVKPGVQVGIFQSRSLHDFNFYSRIKRFEVLNRPKDLVEFLSRPGPRFVLARERSMRAIKRTWRGDLTPALAHRPNASGWFTNTFPRWVLLYSCTSECEPLS
jgi:4-amino-4-deoxy-L-arabinose transferase-like glycosyltransferase